MVCIVEALPIPDGVAFVRLKRLRQRHLVNINEVIEGLFDVEVQVILF